MARTRRPAPPWPTVALDPGHFLRPPREFGILPFWFLNGELDPEEMRLQLREFRDKGMPGIILHGRFGLETPYIGDTYLERIRLAADEAEKLGLDTWIYDEMNWPSGTADKRVLGARPDLAQRYIECVTLEIRGPWFACLTGGDSRYLDFERSTPVAAFGLGGDGQIVDLTPNLSFENVIPWEVPEGNWRLLYIVEKRADYYIDALDPESTTEFLRIGYDPYAEVLDGHMGGQVPGFYTDEPAMHYYLTGGDNWVLPWTKDMFRRFRERTGYDLRRRLPDLFFETGERAARTRYDFYTTLTELYSDAYYRQIHDWCKERGVLFTGHLLYEEWLRRMIRVEGNLFSHLRHLDVTGVDHLYPIIGSRDRPDEHVAMKVASSAAHHFGSERLLCESFGGIFIDATMERMKWVADWEYALGVNLLNPHGFHYTMEGPRKRDWPPSMFYQYPWWHYYGAFSDYIARLSYMLTGGSHAAKVAVLWPINAMFATYTPQARTPLGERIESDTNALTDHLLRLHHDFDFLDESTLAEARLEDGAVQVADEAYELAVLPPMAHIELRTLERLEEHVRGGGRVLGMVILPDRAFAPDGSLVDVRERVRALFGVDPAETLAGHREVEGTEVVRRDHEGGGAAAFLRTAALSRGLPSRLQRELGQPGRPESGSFLIEPDGDGSRYLVEHADGRCEDVTAEVSAEREAIAAALAGALDRLVDADVRIANAELFSLHRRRDGRELLFVVNPTSQPQRAEVSLRGELDPVLWDPSTGERRPLAPSHVADGRTGFALELPPVGSAFVLGEPAAGVRVVEADVEVAALSDEQLSVRGNGGAARVVVERAGERHELTADLETTPEPLVLDGDWQFSTPDANALVVRRFRAAADEEGAPDAAAYTGPEEGAGEWLDMVPGAWSYQLPAEPERAYPIPVWYRFVVTCEHVPGRADLLIDGFAGLERAVYVNGREVTSPPRRSAVDSQIAALEVSSYLKEGENVFAVRLTVGHATDGLLDLVKLVGEFALEGGEGSPRLVAPHTALAPAPWTEQGYPFLSGRGEYRRRFELPEAFRGCEVTLQAEMGDDVIEVELNGRPLAVRLWRPYAVELGDALVEGENELCLRVANTAANLLGGRARPSGLAGPPRLVARRRVELAIPA